MLLGLGGKMGAGKDTVADVLVDKYGFKKIAFADSLKELCSFVFEVPVNSFYDRDIKDSPFNLGSVVFNDSHLNRLKDYLNEMNIEVTDESIEKITNVAMNVAFTSPRTMMQFVGTEICRNCVDPDIWINITMNTIKKNKHNDYVISDCRLENERTAIREAGGKVGLVLRPGIEMLYNNGNSEHTSENDLGSKDDYHFIFHNVGTLYSFQEDILMWYFLRGCKI